MTFFSRFRRMRARVPKLFLKKMNGRILCQQAFGLASLFILESCLAPDPRLYQIEPAEKIAPADTLQQTPPGSSVREPSRRNEAELEPPATLLPATTVANASSPLTPILEKPEAKQSAAVLRSNDPALKLVREAGKTFGIYRLRAGEALYSAVVVRFTGRVEAVEVNRVAQELMAANSIGDETKIPAGAEIRIPLELIDESFFTEKAPPPVSLSRRGHFRHVILDAGHGGNDPGTIVRGLREDEIAFDLMNRVQAGLIRQGLQVHTLVSAYHAAGKMTNGHAAAREGKRHQFVKVTPAYNMEDSRIGLNLRIYLVENIYTRLLREGAAPEDIAFISIHLDHLHPAVGGTMMYIPEAKERPANFKVTGEVFDKYPESRGQEILFAARQNRLAEIASAALAQSILGKLRHAGLPIHAHQPVRRYVYRGGGKWTPGIIRYSRVPASILIEVANLANRADWQKIRTGDFRQRWAEALVRAIVASGY